MKFPVNSIPSKHMGAAQSQSQSCSSSTLSSPLHMQTEGMLAFFSFEESHCLDPPEVFALTTMLVGDIQPTYGQTLLKETQAPPLWRMQQNQVRVFQRVEKRLPGGKGAQFGFFFLFIYLFLKY